MKKLSSLALRFENNKLLVLNQQELPLSETWLECHSPAEMVDIIKTLKVRGAPLIGIAAALSLAHFVEQGASSAEIEEAAVQLVEARPTAVNLSFCISQQMKAYHEEKEASAIVRVAEYLFQQDALLSEAIANYGADLIQSGETILTHCNTGGLVTTGIGTALGAIIQAHNQGKKIHVIVDETRPLLQGARLTAWELSRHGIPYTLICDNMAASLMQKGKIHRAIVGADRIAANGDSANKIGTYGVAALCYLHHIPFHIAAPQTTFDWSCPNGESIVIEERAANEVRGALDKIIWSPPSCAVYNPSFDVTPKKFISSFITDSGVLSVPNKDLCTSSSME